YNTNEKKCSLGLSHPLLELHEDGIIRLNCKIDSQGWNIAIAEPSFDDFIKSDRITNIELIKS
ncbi:hypothetical protein K8I28_05600, partial [bacterium]|nr:hypothetical protein [bacterium]